MAEDEQLAERVREALAAVVSPAEVVEKRMFGAVAFLVGGHIAVGVRETDVLVRIPPDEVPGVLESEPSTRPFQMGRGPARGWVLVGPAGARDDADLRRWVARGVAYAQTLPPS